MRHYFFFCLTRQVEQGEECFDEVLDYIIGYTVVTDAEEINNSTYIAKFCHYTIHLDRAIPCAGLDDGDEMKSTVTLGA